VKLTPNFGTRTHVGQGARVLRHRSLVDVDVVVARAEVVVTAEAGDLGRSGRRGTRACAMCPTGCVVKAKGGPMI